MIGKRFLFALLVGVPLVLAAPAHAFVYWADEKSNTIGRANNDGTLVTDSFIHTGAIPDAVAVDSTHIYWANRQDGTIGRASIDGSAVDNSFITEIGTPSGVAVNGSFIYWSSLSGNEIGRAKLNGTGKKLNFVPGVEIPCGVALDAGHVYWTSATAVNQKIGRAGLDGSSPTPNWASISGAGPCGIAVNSANVFWTETGSLGGPGHHIGRVNVNTAVPDNSLIEEAAGPCGIALDSSAHLLWANEATGTIGRARVDATEQNESFIATGGKQICGIAVDDLYAPPGATPAPPAPEAPKESSALQLGALKRNLKKGTALMTVVVGGAGTLTLSGKGVARVTKTVKGLGFAKLLVKPKGGALKTLTRKGQVSLKVTVLFAQTGDNPSTRSRSVLLKRAG